LGKKKKKTKPKTKTPVGEYLPCHLPKAAIQTEKNLFFARSGIVLFNVQQRGHNCLPSSPVLGKIYDLQGASGSHL
jgi:hypothetical protein